MNIALVLLILLIGCIATFCSGNKLARITAMLFSIATTIFSIALYFKGNLVSYEELIPVHKTFASLFRLDGLSMVLTLLTTILLPLIILSATSQAYKKEKLFYSLVLFMAFAMLGAFLSSNALLYYIFWEMSLIPIYFISLMWGQGELEERRKAVMTFFMQTFAGSMFMLLAILYLYNKTLSFQLVDFYNADLNETEQIFVFLGFFLAYAIKTPIFPFHTWQADIYMRTPAVGSMLLAGLMSKMGAYSIIRWQLPVAPEAAILFRPYIIVLCIIGVVYGLLIALRQDNLKRFMAFVSLSHVSFIAAGIYSLTFEGLQGAIILILAHALVIVGLFYLVEIIRYKTNKSLISELGGLKYTAGKYSLAFILITLAAISFPLSFNFIGELNIMIGLYSYSHNLLYPILIGLSLILGAFVFLRMYQYVMLGKTATGIDFKDLSFKEGLILTVIIALIAFFGIYSLPITEMTQSTTNELLRYVMS